MLSGIEDIPHHPILENMVDILCKKTQNTDRKFFRVEVAYFLAKMAASMRTKLNTKDRGEIPVNVYALALAVSGFGKGYSVSTIENDYMAPFHERFLEETFPLISEKHLWEHANKRAARNGTVDAEEFEKIEKEFLSKGPLPFTFDSGSGPALRQIREKLLLGNIGAINLQVDEIGSNLEGSMELLNLFLELYDQGQIKQKIVKNSNENKRSQEILGKTPSNVLLFGTPAKLLDGGKTEEAFYSLLDTGYARRCIFAYGKLQRAAETQTAEEIYRRLIEPVNKQSVDAISEHFENLADPAKYNWLIDVPDDVAIKLLEYKIYCEKLADELPEHQEIQKTEITHRYFKALKLAGTYAFVDEELILSMENLIYAIKLVEESGEAFMELLNREKNYMKLARYLAAEKTEQTHADLTEALAFYKSGTGARNELMSMATAWGYRQHIMIKKTFVDGIEFFKGETLEETNLDEMIVSYSNHYAFHYLNERVPFDNLEVIFKTDRYNWINHFTKDQHRLEEKIIPGFNMIVLDVDGGTPVHTVHELLKDYKFMTYTTKRHTDEEHRFRLILPMCYVLNLDSDEYNSFMTSVLGWLPFKVDESANQRARKWLSNPNGEFFHNDGMLLDPLEFVPKTQKNEQYLQKFQTIESMDNLERWFAQRIATGNRNNQMIKFAMALYDSGFTYAEIEQRVLHFNSQLSNRLTEDELRSTVLLSVGKKFA